MLRKLIIASSIEDKSFSMTYFYRLVWYICNILKLLSNNKITKYQVFRFINSQLKHQRLHK